MSKIVQLRPTLAAVPSIENEEVRPSGRRRHLTPDEVEAKLIPAAGRLGRHGHRDATLILLAYRHGFRVSELVALRWDAIDLRQGLVHVARLKNGVPSTHPLRGPELRTLRRLQRDYPPSPYVSPRSAGGRSRTPRCARSSRGRGAKRSSSSRSTHTC